MRNQFIALVTFLIATIGFSQSNLNDYQYVIIPKEFDFLKEVDQYQLNSLTKFLIEKEGFTVLYDDETVPAHISSNRCLALYGNVFNDSKLFKTKLRFSLKDCNNKEVFVTRFGESRLKDYKKAYHEALRNAFRSFETINYNYEPKIEDNSVEVAKAPDIVDTKPSEPESVSVTQVDKSTKPESSKNEVVTSEIVYAQKIDNGYQVVDSTPKIVMILLETPLEHVFMVKDNNVIVFKQDGFWYKSTGGYSMEPLNIKF